MKSGKTIETAQRALEILQNLMKQDLNVDEILDLLTSKEDYSIVYTREAIYKYFNTFKVMGIDITKGKGKYHINKGAGAIALSDENILMLGFLEDYIKSSQQPEMQKKFLHIKNLIEKNNVNLVNKILSFNSENILKEHKKYKKYFQLISKLEQFCVDKQKIKLFYTTIDNIELEYTIVADELVYSKGVLLLRAYCVDSYDIAHFNIEQINKTEILPQKFSSSFFIKTAIFKVSRNLALNYKLKNGESIKEQGNGYMVIMNNYQNYDELMRRLFRYGENCEILYPQSLREDMLKRIEDTLNLYKNGSNN